MAVKYVRMEHHGRYHLPEQVYDLDVPELREQYQYTQLWVVRCGICDELLYYATGYLWTGKRTPFRRIRGSKAIDQHLAYVRDHKITDPEHRKGAIAVKCQLRHDGRSGSAMRLKAVR